MGARDTVIEEYAAQLQACMYQYSRAIYRSIKDLIDPYVAPELHLEYRRAVLEQCEQTMERLARDPLYFAKPDRALFQDIRRYFPITAQAEVAWAVQGRRRRGGRVHRGADRGRRARRRRCTLPRDDAQGEAVPADAAPGTRLLPVAPAPRALEGRRLAGGSARRLILARPQVAVSASLGRRVPACPSRAWHVTDL